MGALPHVVQYRRKDLAGEWIDMAAFDVEGAAESYRDRCEEGNPPWEYRVARAPTDEDPTTLEAQAGSEAAWQWRSRIIGGAWDAWENGRYGHVPPPFMEVEERQIPSSPPDAAYWKGAYERMAARNVDFERRLSLRDTFIAEKGLWSEFAETVLHQQSSLEASGE